MRTTSLIDQFDKMNRSHNAKLAAFVNDRQNRTLAWDYIAHGERSFNPGLNLFMLISDQYQKENLHSDILKEILDTKGAHEEGDRFLMAFIDYLNKRLGDRRINKEFYKNAFVDREKDRIDIAIKDAKSKRAIIIENKINAAPDMDQQIPRYWAKLEKQGYTIDLVVYLILNGRNKVNLMVLLELSNQTQAVGTRRIGTGCCHTCFMFALLMKPHKIYTMDGYGYVKHSAKT